MADIIYYKQPPKPATPVTTAITYVQPDKKILKVQVTKDILNPGDVLNLNQSLVSKSGRFRFNLGADGNLSVQDGTKYIWQAGVNDQGGKRLVMQADGNLVLYRDDNSPVWATETDASYNGAYFIIQDDGNGVVYKTAHSVTATVKFLGVVIRSDTIDAPLEPLWDTSEGKHQSWLTKVVATCGRPFAVIIDTASGALKGIGTLLSEIPIIGAALHGILLIASGPFNVTEALIHGERLDKAVIDDLRDKLTAIREIGPYAQTIVSFIPGIGTGVAAAIGAGLAVAQGRPIDEAFMEGIKGALPGGPIARTAFAATVAIAKGDNVIQASATESLTALGLGQAAAEIVKKALVVAYHGTQGDNIALAALEEARSYIPKEGRQAFDVAVACIHGEKLQNALMSEVGKLVPSQIEKVQTLGKNLIKENPVLKDASDTIEKTASTAQKYTGAAKQAIGQVTSTVKAGAKTAKDGCEFGLGIMRHGGVNEDSLTAIRSQLSPAEQQGFDVAVATYNSLVRTHVTPASVATSAAKAKTTAYLITTGLNGNNNPMAKKDALQYFMVDSNSKQGIDLAAHQIHTEYILNHPVDTLWTWVKGEVSWLRQNLNL